MLANFNNTCNQLLFSHSKFEMHRSNDIAPVDKAAIGCGVVALQSALWRRLIGTSRMRHAVVASLGAVAPKSTRLVPLALVLLSFGLLASLSCMICTQRCERRLFCVVFSNRRILRIAIATSLIEEEHESWYFLIATVLALRLVELCAINEATWRRGVGGLVALAAVARAARAWNQSGVAWSSKVRLPIVAIWIVFCVLCVVLFCS